jgi:hypothetical protein
MSTDQLETTNNLKILSALLVKERIQNDLVFIWCHIEECSPSIGMNSEFIFLKTS